MGRGWSAAAATEPARREFIDHGYDAASINRIIDASPVSRATFYKHFDSKLQLFFVTVADVLTRMGRSLPPDDPHAPFWVVVGREVAAGHAYGREHPGDVVLLHEGIRIAADHPSDPTAMAIIEAVRSRTRAWIDRGLALGEVRGDLDAEVAVDLVISTVQTLDRHHLADDAAHRDPEAIAEQYVDLLRRMLAP